MIEAVVGLPGSGKTLWATNRLIQAKRRGRDTIANFHSRTGMWEFGLWLDIVNRGNCLAVIDEAHMWFSARSWGKTQQAELSYFQQHRKEGIDLLWIAQHQDRVDVAVREVTAFIWKVRKLGPFCWITKTTPEEPKRPLKRILWKIDPGIFNHYFTEERIGFRDGEGYRLGGGAAYAQRRGGVELIDPYHLSPNTFRIEWPTGQIQHIAANSPTVGLVVGRALASWQLFGSAKEAEDFVTPLYVVGGRVQELTTGGEIVVSGVKSDVFTDAKSYMAGWLRALSSGSVEVSVPALKVQRGRAGLEDGARLGVRKHA